MSFNSQRFPIASAAAPGPEAYDEPDDTSEYLEPEPGYARRQTHPRHQGRQRVPTRAPPPPELAFDRTSRDLLERLVVALERLGEVKDFEEEEEEEQYYEPPPPRTVARQKPRKQKTSGRKVTPTSAVRRRARPRGGY